MPTSPPPPPPPPPARRAGGGGRAAACCECCAQGQQGLRGGAKEATRFSLTFGAAMSATTLLHPFEVLRIQQQTTHLAVAGRARWTGSPQGKLTMLDSGRLLVRNTGWSSLYSGFNAGVFRQFTYGSPRIALYGALLEHFGNPQPPVRESAVAAPGGGDECRRRWRPPLHEMVLFSAVAGAATSITGNPAEVVYVRMCSYPGLYPTLRACVRGVIGVCEGGPPALFCGLHVSMWRNMLFNCGQLAAYSSVRGDGRARPGDRCASHRAAARPDGRGGRHCPLSARASHRRRRRPQSKDVLTEHTPLRGVPLYTVSALFASVCAIALSGPLDTAKSRAQATHLEWRNPFAPTITSMLREIVEKRGVRALWSGASSAIWSNAPHTVITMLVLEQLTRLAFGQEAL